MRMRRPESIFGILFFLSFCFFFTGVARVYAAGCADGASVNDVQALITKWGTLDQADSTKWTCTDVTDITKESSQISKYCVVSSGCQNGQFCCVPDTRLYITGTNTCAYRANQQDINAVEPRTSYPVSTWSCGRVIGSLASKYCVSSPDCDTKNQESCCAADALVAVGGDECAFDVTDQNQVLALEGKAGIAPAMDWSCQQVGDLTTDQKVIASYCVKADKIGTTCNGAQEYCCTPGARAKIQSDPNVPAGPLGDDCALAADETEVAAVKSPVRTAEWYCQNVSPDLALNGCVKSAVCSGGKMCCPPGIGALGRPQQSAGATKASAAPGFTLSNCTTDGKCQLDDLVRTGVNFARYLFGLSGAVFLAIFIYGGLRYLLAGGGDDTKKARDMLVNATIGMIIIFAANTAVRFIYTSLTNPAAQATKCDTTYGSQGYSCRTLGDASEAAQLGCMQDKKGGNNGLCGNAGANVYCCSIDAPKPQAKTTSK
ncbi:MAG TPA: pilin [Patescibacteria group bacterium]|nr:pilin [Patescibacteria group bacterium]